ncbi:MAG TPA: peptidoglycan-associated lipoprotein Pal [Steroidobacteraceae bacterium]|nr:peptidoglycan-associated lipoprotein Pal [Steroidobacteraceae bacterium]
MKHSTLIVLVAAALLAAGCAGKRPATDASGSGESVAAGSADSSGAQSSGVATVNASGGATSGGALGPDGPLGSQRVIYFDFDSSDIRNEYVDVIAAHGRFLAGNATVRVRLEGHTDERGSREYNIGLGERRAQTVRRALALQGVQESQITTVSYGEERPAAAGSDENAYSKNRRVEIVYIN